MTLNSNMAYSYLQYAKKQNNGNWINHSFYVGEAAGLIADNLLGIDSDKARALGYIHDIGRCFGDMKINHIFKGYYFMKNNNYNTAARICLTHSFPIKDVSSVTGIWDCDNSEYEFLRNYLENINYDIYDKLIQFCDNVALANGITVLEKRLVDIVRRYGIDNKNLLDRWDRLFSLKDEFEKLMDKDVDTVLGLKTIASRDEFL